MLRIIPPEMPQLAVDVTIYLLWVWALPTVAGAGSAYSMRASAQQNELPRSQRGPFVSATLSLWRVAAVAELSRIVGDTPGSSLGSYPRGPILESPTTGTILEGSTSCGLSWIVQVD